MRGRKRCFSDLKIDSSTQCATKKRRIDDGAEQNAELDSLIYSSNDAHERMKLILTRITSSNRRFFSLIKGKYKRVSLIRISEKVEKQVYSNILEFVEDLWLLDSSMEQESSKNSKRRLVKNFRSYLLKNDAEFSSQLRICCFQSRKIAPSVSCQSCNVEILPRRKYFKFTGNNYSRKKYCLCPTCYNRLSGTNQKYFITKFNMETIVESKVQCNVCQQLFHRRCVNDVERNPSCDFICNFCRPSGLSQMNWCSLVPHTALSQNIEERINADLPNNCIPIRIREFSDAQKSIQLDATIGDVMKLLDIQNNIPYTARTIMAFMEKTETEFAAIFTIYLQEYHGSSSCLNKNYIYVSIVDSVQLLEPSTLRRQVYYGVLLQYLNVMRKRRYETAFIWSCPPTRPGDEYVYFRRPAPKNILPPSVLQLWYKSLIKKGMDLGIIERYTNWYEYCSKQKNEVDFLIKFPIFEDNMWMTELTNAVDEVKKSRNLIKMGCNNYRLKTFLASVRKILIQKMKIDQGSFFAISLSQPKNRIDEEIPLSSELGTNRLKLIDLMKKKTLEFSDIRKSVFSTHSIISAICEEHIKICDMKRCRWCRQIKRLF